MDFNVEINASKEKVWDVLLGNETYPQSTKAFSKDSNVITN